MSAAGAYCGATVAGSASGVEVAAAGRPPTVSPNPPDGFMTVPFRRRLGRRSVRTRGPLATQPGFDLPITIQPGKRSRLMAWTLSNRLFSIAILVSGFSALIYQLIWVRLLGLVFGVSSFAVATVVAVFLLGLGLGSYFFGKWSERTTNPLRTYMYVEVCIAVASVASYVVIDYLPVYRYLYESAYNHLDFYGMSVVRLMLSVVVLLPPVFFIGGTLPLIAKYLLTTTTTFGSGFSRIYYLNTLGAFAGALLTGFVLVRYLGIFATLMIAVAGNLLVAIIIGGSKSSPGTPPESTESRVPYSYMLLVLFLTGFISLSYEVLWARILSTFGLSTSQAFAVIVAGFLLGFSVGSILVSRGIDRRTNLQVFFGTVCVLTALSGAFVLFLFRRFEALTAFLENSLPVGLLTVNMTLSFAVSFIPAVFMGMLFPLGLKIYAHDVHRIGDKAGKILFANTGGCVLGSLLTGFVLIPFVGMWNTTLILVNLSLLIALALLLRARDSVRAHWAFLLLVGVFANLLVFSDSKTFHKKMDGFDVVYYAEGLSGTVSVIERQDYRGLFVDGQNVSGTDPVLVADSKMLAHLPLLLADDPQRALTVGYGTGTTSGSMLLHDVAVDAVEIEEKIIEAAPLFSEVNRRSYGDPSLALVLDDARNYIGVANKQFDVIVTDVTNLKYKRNPYLYTREYFRLMQDALAENGIAAAWLPVGGLSFEDLRILIATFDRVFAHTTLWYFTQYPTHFVIALGTPERTVVDLETLQEKVEGLTADLRTIGVDNVYEIAGMLLLGERGVDDLVQGARLHTDNHPVLEFSDMGLYMMTDVAPNLERLLKYRKKNLAEYFIGSDQQLATLERHFDKYVRNYRNYVRAYERTSGVGED
jgi:spermidine synthase